MRNLKLLSALFIGASLFFSMGQNCFFVGEDDNGFFDDNDDFVDDFEDLFD